MDEKKDNNYADHQRTQSNENNATECIIDNQIKDLLQALEKYV